MVTFSLLAGTLLASKLMFPLKSLNRPTIFANPRWSIVNKTWECVGSIVQSAAWLAVALVSWAATERRKWSRAGGEVSRLASLRYLTRKLCTLAPTRARRRAALGAAA